MTEIPQYSISDFLSHPLSFPSFHMNRLEEMPPLPEFIVSPHKHRFIEIFLVQEGTMEHNVDVNRYHIQPDNLFFIAQGQFHFWCKTLSPLKGFRLMFEERFVEGLMLHHHLIFELVHLNQLYHRPLLAVPSQSRQRITTCFELLLEEYLRSNPNKQVLVANLYLLLMEVLRLSGCESEKEASHYHLQQYQQLIQQVEKSVYTQRSVEWYAEQLHLSVAQLNRIVGKLGNTTTTKFIQNRKMLEAKRLLTTTKLTIQEIALSLGFEDTSYFSRLFRKKEGLTPQEFRTRM